MKVFELIEELKKLPQDKDVYIERESCYCDSLDVWEYKNSTYPEDETYIVISPAS